jgi:hypothetical protein
MKKPYQIESQQAVKRLERMAADGNPHVQLVLPMAETLGWLRKGVGELIRQAGLQMMELMMERRSSRAGRRTESATTGTDGQPLGARKRAIAW